MTTDTWIEQSVAGFIERRAQVSGVGHDLRLFDTGLINSLFVVELLSFLESHFQLQITADDLDLEHFATINSIGAFVRGKSRDPA